MSVVHLIDLAKSVTWWRAAGVVARGASSGDAPFIFLLPGRIPFWTPVVGFLTCDVDAVATAEGEFSSSNFFDFLDGSDDDDFLGSGALDKIATPEKISDNLAFSKIAFVGLL